MEPLENARHEKFCQLLASGMSQTQAYIKAGFSEKGASVSASQLLGNPSVSARLAHLQEQIADAFKVTKQTAIKRLWAIVEGEEKSDKVRMTAFGLISKMMGWEADTKVEVKHSIDASLKEMFTRVAGTTRKLAQ